MDPIICVELELSVLYLVAVLSVLWKILSAELGYCIECTVCISSMQILKKPM